MGKLEPAIGTAVRSYATRGKVHVNIELTGRRGLRILVG